ncbi:hypothetical protein BCEN4_1240006 [Burkholderia cenocepacia]|nr:hypothetical protein BCEN4_1240006 [Burkholderia cenocepacia]
MRCHRSQELRAYPVSKRGWMSGAGRTGPSAGVVALGRVLFLKGFLLFSWVFPPRRCLENSSGSPS